MDNLHVHAPTAVMLLCGGPIDMEAEASVSMRDAFLRVRHNPPLNRIETRLAEEANIYQKDSSYKNWMDFESDLAEVCQVVALFCESEGSYSELGTFARIDEIARKLIIFIDSENSKHPSYINLGPIDAVKQKYGKDRLFVIHLADVGLKKISDIANIDLENLKRIISDYIVESIDKNKEPRSFDPRRNGHLIKLLTGLVQHFGALTDSEILNLFERLRIDSDIEDIRKFYDIAAFLEWLTSEQRGTKVFIVPLQEKDAIEYALVEGAPTLNKVAWRLKVREYWSKNEPDRFSALTAHMLRGVS